MGTQEETVPKGGKLESRPLADFIPTKDNPRTIRPKDPATKELAESLKELGQLQPVVARPHPKKPGKLDLRAGHRRLEAAKRAGLENLLVIVQDMTDRQALEVTVAENLQREDLTPFEEAAGVDTLVRKGWEVRDVAAHIGKTPEWVLRRARLAHLSPAWKKFGENPDNEITIAALELVARFDKDVQEAVFKSRDKWHWERSDSKYMRGVLADWTLALKSAPFDVEDATLCPKIGTCSSCRKRSSHNPGLFDDLDASPEKIKADDRCLDRKCWKAKRAAVDGRKLAETKKEHGEVLRIHTEFYSPYYGAKPPANSTKLGDKLIRSSKGAKGSKPAVIVDGEEKGEIVWVQSAASARAGTKRTPGKPTPLKPTPLKDRREALKQRREVLVLQELVKRVEKVEKVPTDLLLRLAAVFGTEHRNAYSSTPYYWAEFGRTKKASAVGKLWKQVREVLLSRITYTGAACRVPLNEAAPICKILKIDLKALRAAAAKDIPVPKSWARLNEDGTPKAKAAKKPKAKKAGKAKGKKKPAKIGEGLEELGEAYKLLTDGAPAGKPKRRRRKAGPAAAATKAKGQKAFRGKPPERVTAVPDGKTANEVAAELGAPGKYRKWKFC